MKKMFLLTLFILVFGFMGLVAYAEGDSDNDENNYSYGQATGGDETDYAQTLGDIEYCFDEVLWKAIVEYLGIEAEDGEEVRGMDIADITELDLSGKGIESLDGIEKLTALAWLNISGNYLERLYFPENIELYYIDASDNNLTYVNLSANVNLKYVDLSGNEYLDAIDMRANTLLQRVDLRSTNVTEPLLPVNMRRNEDEELLFYVYFEEETEEPEEPEEIGPYDGVPVDEERVKYVIFNAIDWNEIDLGDRTQDIYLRVSLAYERPYWTANFARVIDTRNMEVALQEPPGTLETIFAWVLVISAILSFMLSIVLFMLRKE